jgi:hypothetical protein
MAGALLAALVFLAGQQAATGSAAPAPATSAQNPAAQATPASAQPPSSTDLPVSLDRIQRALAEPPAIDLKEQHPVFRVEVYGRKPTLEDILGERFWIGPTPYGGMTHQEFLDMVTPKLAQPYGGFTGKYLVAETALTLAEQWALKEAIKKFQSAINNHEREAARKEVMDALAALEKARRDAGLPPK